MSEHYGKDGKATSIRKVVFSLLDKNPLFTPKTICQLMKLPYHKYKNYITKLRHNWKYYHQNQRGSKCSESHRCVYKAQVLRGEGNREVLEGNNFWVLSKARNRFWVFKNRCGRVVWFETGNVLMNVHKPANLGKAKQLFCDAFFKTGIVTDVTVLNNCLSRVHIKGAHLVFETVKRLPKMKIDTFADSHGIIIKLGDRSHPHAVEVIFEYQEELEKLGDLREGFAKFMANFNALFTANGNGTKPPKGLYE